MKNGLKRNPRLAYQMAIAGVGLTELATRAGVSRCTASKIFCGRSRPYPETAGRIAAALGVRVESLFASDEIIQRPVKAGGAA
jgi:transcriptional regulator with XRE-family HTH domain